MAGDDAEDIDHLVQIILGSQCLVSGHQQASRPAKRTDWEGWLRRCDLSL